MQKESKDCCNQMYQQGRYCKYREASSEISMKTAKGPVAWYLKRKGFRAITLPPLGIYALPGSEADKKLETHERMHWQQYLRMGFFKFYAVYLWYTFKYGYYANPMEIEARQAERGSV